MRDRLQDLLERISDRLDLSREAWARIGLTVGITLAITGIIIATALPSRGMVNSAIADFHTQTDTISQQVQDAISQGQDALNQAQCAVQNITDALGIQMGELDLYNDQLANAFDRLSAIENNLANFHCSLPEGYLAGSFPNYTLYVKSSEAGNFTANVHLAYQPAIGNTTSYNQTLTEFHIGINFTGATPSYAPVVTLNGVDWGISEIWFNIGIYELETPAEMVIPITCWGLNRTPSFAYVEVYPI